MADHRTEHHKIEQLKTLLDRDPNDEVALFGLGKAYLKFIFRIRNDLIEIVKNLPLINHLHKHCPI